MMQMLQSAPLEAPRPDRSAHPRRKIASLSPRRLSARLSRLSENILPAPLAMRLIAQHERRWGEPELRLLSQLVPRDAVAVDVGAAEGVYSWFLARYARACHAFEANPATASALRRRLPRAQVHACALSDHAGELELRTPIVAGIPYLGWATTQPTNIFSDLPEHEVVTARVPCVTLDSFGLENVGFIKIDVEGHELAVLKGALATLRSSLPDLLIEAEDRHRPDALRLVSDFLAPLAYRGWFLDDRRIVPLGRRNSHDPNAKQTARRPINNFLFCSEGRPAGSNAAPSSPACLKTTPQ